MKTLPIKITRATGDATDASAIVHDDGRVEFLQGISLAPGDSWEFLFRRRGVDHSRYQRRRAWYHLELGKLAFHINGAWLPDFQNTRPK